MLCKPSFPTPHCQAVDANKDITLQCMHNFGVVGDCKFSIYSCDTGELKYEFKTPKTDFINPTKILHEKYNTYTEIELLKSFSVSPNEYSKIQVVNENIEHDFTILDQNGNLIFEKVDQGIWEAKVTKDANVWIRVRITNESAHYCPELNNNLPLVKPIEFFPSEDAIGITSNLPIHSLSEVSAKINSNTLSNGSDYIWSVTLYEEDNALCNIVTNYGSLMKIPSYSSDTGIITFSLRPDTSLASYFNSYDSGDGKILDAKKKFYINIGSKSYLINTYKMIADSSTENTNLYTSAEATAILADSASWAENTPYTITCNFVESDNYILYARSTPEIKINMNGVDISPGIENTVDLQSVEASFIGTYYQAENVAMSSYEAILYEISYSGFKEVFHTKSKNASQIKFEYNRFISGEEYAIIFKIIDSYGRCIESEPYYIKPTYSIAPSGYTPLVEYLDNSTSVMLDWSQTKAITPDIIPSDVQEIYIDDDYGFEVRDFNSERNGVLISGDTALEWSKVNGCNELEIPSDCEYVWEGFVSLLYVGKVFEVESDDGLVSYIRFEDNCFYIKHFTSSAEIECAMYDEKVSLFDSAEYNDNSYISWGEGEDWAEKSEYRENPLGSGFWWRVTVRPTTFTVSRIKRVKEAING